MEKRKGYGHLGGTVSGGVCQRGSIHVFDCDRASVNYDYDAGPSAGGKKTGYGTDWQDGSLSAAKYMLSYCIFLLRHRLAGCGGVACAGHVLAI